MVILLPLLIAIIGLLLYVLSNNPANPKPAEIGRIMFFVGMLATLLRVAPGLTLIR